MPPIDLASLPDDDALSGTDQVILNDAGTAKDVTVSRLAAFAQQLSRVTVGDASATLDGAARWVSLTTAPTAARTLTLPAAATFGARVLTIADEVGVLGGTFGFSVAAAGSDTINGAASFPIVTKNAVVSFTSDGTSRWTVDIRGIGRGGTGATTALAAAANFDLIPSQTMAPWSIGDAPIYLDAGQSNAEAWGSTLAVGDQINTPLTNVFVLTNANQDYSRTDVTWTGYTSGNAMIGDNPTAQRPTTAYYIAKEWQRRINAGEALPNLYILHVAHGSQGIHPSLGGAGMWSYLRSDTATDSYYHMTRHLLSLAIRNLQTAGKNVRFLGCNWNQWESEIAFTQEAADEATGSFRAIINGFSDAVGTDIPFTFWVPRSFSYNFPARFVSVRDQILALQASNPGQFSLMDAGDHPDFLKSAYDAALPTYIASGASAAAPFGIFHNDNVHYLAKIHEWAAGKYIDKWLVQGYRGVPIRRRVIQTPSVRETRNILASLTAPTATIDTAIRTSLITDGAAQFIRRFPSIAAPAFCVGALRHVDTFSAALLRMFKASDGTTTTDIASLNESPSDAAIATFLTGEANPGQVLPFDQISGAVLTQATPANRPTWSQTLNNNRGGLLFNGTSQLLTSAARSLGTAHTIMIVATLPQSGAIRVLTGNVATAFIVYTAGSSTQGFTYVAGTGIGAGQVFWPWVATSGPAILIFRRNGSSVDLFINGVKQTTQTATALAALTLAGLGGFGTFLHSGAFYAETEWTSALSDAQCAELYNLARIAYGTA